MDRRTWLGGLYAGTFSLTFPKSAWAADHTWPDFSFLVVTDTHLGHKKNDAAARLWAKAVPELAEAHGDFVLHLGDVVDSRQSELYASYKNERKKIGKPVHEIPGNHDEPTEFEAHLGVESDRVIDHKGVRFVLFNNSRNDSHDGFVSDRQLEWIATSCGEAAAKGKWILFCSHVPFHRNRHPDRGWYVKPENGQREFYKIVEKHKSRVLGAFHGHFHNGIRGWDDNAPLHEILFPSALYNQKRGLKEKGAPGYNLEEFRAGFTRILLKDRKMHLRYHVIGAGASLGEKLAYPPA